MYVSRLRRGARRRATRSYHDPARLCPAAAPGGRSTPHASSGSRREARCGGDAARAASCCEALALWRGPALVDFAYEPFAQAEIARLEELRLAALEARIEADLRRAPPRAGRRAERLWRRTAARARGQLMVALSAAAARPTRSTSTSGARARSTRARPRAGPELRALEAASSRRRRSDRAAGAARVPRAADADDRARGRTSSAARALAPSAAGDRFGPGGVGKTRLALEAARRRRSPTARIRRRSRRWPRPSTWPRRSSRRSASPRPGRAARGRAGAPPRSRELLLILDNFEHVLDAAPLVAELLARRPRLTVLATSREPLRIRAERVFRARAARVPTPSSCSLRCARARDPRSRGSDAAAIGRDLPAARRAAAGDRARRRARRAAVRRTSSPAARRRARRARRAARATRPARQRTLRATLDWSHDLLDAPRSRRRSPPRPCSPAAHPRRRARPSPGRRSTCSRRCRQASCSCARDGRLGMLETSASSRASGSTDAEARAPRATASTTSSFAEAAAPAGAHRRPRCWPRLAPRSDNVRAALSWAIGARRRRPRCGSRRRSHRYWRCASSRGGRALARGGARARTRGVAGRGAGGGAGRVRRAGSTTAGRRRTPPRALRARRWRTARHSATSRTAASLCSLGVHPARGPIGSKEAYELAGEARASRTTSADAPNAVKLQGDDGADARRRRWASARRLRRSARGGNLRRLGRLQASLAYTAVYHDDPGIAAELGAEALEVGGGGDDPHLVALTPGNAGLAALCEGRPRRARPRIRPSVAAGRAPRLRGAAVRGARRPRRRWQPPPAETRTPPDVTAPPKRRRRMASPGDRRAAREAVLRRRRGRWGAGLGRRSGGRCPARIARPRSTPRTRSTFILY